MYFFTDTTDVSLSTPEDGSLGPGVTARLRITASVAQGMTFRLCLSAGQIVIYASTRPNPSSAHYIWHYNVSANAFPINCLTQYYDLRGTSSVSVNENRRRKRQQALSDTISVYITLEGQEDINTFTFNSSAGNETFGKISTGLILVAIN